MSFWLLKSEPSTFGIQHLAERPKQREPWNGVRNYQARNFLRAMKVGDRAYFYHSNCPVPGIVGTVKIVRAAYPDDTAFDPKSPYFDAKSTLEKPRWFMVDVQLEKIFDEVISLQQLKANPHLDDFALLRQGSRLSVMPVSETNWAVIQSLV
jgi:predicted RNA-binding protein with PUA-like domain